MEGNKRCNCISVVVAELFIRQEDLVLLCCLKTFLESCLPYLFNV